MRGIIEYILRGRRQALMVAIPAMVLPLTGWIAGSIVGLWTLRKGIREGAILLLMTAIPAVVFAAFGHTELLVGRVLYGILCVWVLASALRHFESWQKVLQIAAALGIAIIVIVHLYNADLYAWWETQLATYLKEIGTILPLNELPPDEFQEVVKRMARMATGFQVVVITFMSLLQLLIARWSQAFMFNPGGLGKELHALRLSQLDTGVLILCSLGLMLKMFWVLDFLPAVLLPFLFAGLCTVHGLMWMTSKPAIGLVISYVVLFFLFPYTLWLLILLAVGDSILDFRKRLNKARGKVK